MIGEKRAALVLDHDSKDGTFDKAPESLLAGPEPFLGLLLHRDVRLNSDEMGHPSARILDRRNGGVGPVDRSVLAPVTELSPPFPAPQDGRPQLAVLLAGHLARLEHARIAADRFLAAVPGHLGKLGIDVFDGSVGIGDEHAGGPLLDRPPQLSEFLLRPLQFGDIPDDGQHMGLSVQHERAGGEHARQDPAVLVAELDLHVPDLALLAQPGHQMLAFLQVGPEPDRGGLPVEHVFLFVTREVGEAVVDIHMEAILQPADGDRVGTRLERVPEALLELVEGLLGEPALRYVLDGAGHSQRVSGVVERDFSLLAHDPNGSVRPDDPVFEVVLRLLVKGRVDRAADPVPVVRVHDVQEIVVGGGRGLRYPSEDPVNLVGPCERILAHVQVPVAETGDALGVRQADLALPQRGFRAHSSRDVGHSPGEAHRFVVAVANAGSARLDPKPFAGLVPVPVNGFVEFGVTLEMRRDVVPGSPQVRGMHVVGPAVAVHLLCVETDDGPPHGRIPNPVLDQIQVPQPVLGPADRHFVAPLAFAERFLNGFQVCHVHDDADDTALRRLVFDDTQPPAVARASRDGAQRVAVLPDALANPDFGIHAVGREDHAAPDVLADVVLEPPAGRQNVVHARVELADLVVEGDQAVLGVPKHEPLGEALDRVLEPVLGAFPFGDIGVNGDHAAAGQGMTACLDDPAIGEDPFQTGLGAALRRAGAARDAGDEFL